MQLACQPCPCASSVPSSPHHHPVSLQASPPLTFVVPPVVPPPFPSGRHLAALLESVFFPKWHAVLHQWLSARPDYDEVTRWFLGWKGLFPEELLAHEKVRRGFNLALDLMNQALAGQMGPMADAGVPPPPPPQAPPPEAPPPPPEDDGCAGPFPPPLTHSRLSVGHLRPLSAPWRLWPLVSAERMLSRALGAPSNAFLSHHPLTHPPTHPYPAQGFPDPSRALGAIR